MLFRYRTVPMTQQTVLPNSLEAGLIQLQWILPACGSITHSTISWGPFFGSAIRTQARRSAELGALGRRRTPFHSLLCALTPAVQTAHSQAISLIVSGLTIPQIVSQPVRPLQDSEVALPSILD